MAVLGGGGVGWVQVGGWVLLREPGGCTAPTRPQRCNRPLRLTEAPARPPRLQVFTRLMSAIKHFQCGNVFTLTFRKARRALYCAPRPAAICAHIALRNARIAVQVARCEVHMHDKPWGNSLFALCRTASDAGND